jgi:hypothetical protein
MFSSLIISLTLYPLPSFRPRLFISLADSMYSHCSVFSADLLSGLLNQHVVVMVFCKALTE